MSNSEIIAEKDKKTKSKKEKSAAQLRKEKELKEIAANVKTEFVLQVEKRKDFYVLPDFFYKDPYNRLNPSAILLYAKLLSKMKQSILTNAECIAEGKPPQFLKDGKVFVIYRRDYAQRDLNLSNKTVCELFKDLINAGLIEQIEQHADNKANLTFVKFPSADDLARIDLIDKSIKKQRVDSTCSESVDSTPSKVKNLHTTNIDIVTDNLSPLNAKIIDESVESTCSESEHSTPCSHENNDDDKTRVYNKWHDDNEIPF